VNRLTSKRGLSFTERCRKEYAFLSLLERLRASTGASISRPATVCIIGKVCLVWSGFVIWESATEWNARPALSPAEWPVASKRKLKPNKRPKKTGQDKKRHSASTKARRKHSREDCWTIDQGPAACHLDRLIAVCDVNADTLTTADRNHDRAAYSSPSCLSPGGG